MSIDTSAISTNSRSSRRLTSFGGREAAGLKGPCVSLVAPVVAVAAETDVPMVAIPAGVGVVAAAEAAAAAKISRLVAAAGLGVKVGIPLITEDPESVG